MLDQEVLDVVERGAAAVGVDADEADAAEPRRRAAPSSSGIIWTHGPHQVAQKSSTTTWPRSALSATVPGVPSMRASAKSGASWPRTIGRSASRLRAPQTAPWAASASASATTAPPTSRARWPAGGGRPPPGRTGRRCPVSPPHSARRASAGAAVVRAGAPAHPDSAEGEQGDRQRGGAVGDRAVERVRAGQLRERALEPGGHEQRAVNRRPPRSRSRPASRRSRARNVTTTAAGSTNQAACCASLANSDTSAHERARGAARDRHHRVHQLGQPERNDRRDHQRQRVAQAAALRLDARERGVGRGRELADAPGRRRSGGAGDALRPSPVAVVDDAPARAASACRRTRRCCAPPRR